MNWPQTEVRTSFWKSTWGKSLLAVLFVAVGAVTWLGAQGVPGGRISDVAATPPYIVVNTPTAVTFTAVISDSNLRKHDPLKVLLVRTDASGNPIDIVGRMRDNGRRGDATRRDRTYSIQTTLNEAVVGPIYFKVAARFSDFARPDRDDDDWDKELGRLSDEKQRSRRPAQLLPLLRKLQRYELSGLVTLGAWNQIHHEESGISIGLPTWSHESRTSFGGGDGQRYLDVKLLHSASGQFVSVFRVTIYDNPSAEPLATWFATNVDDSAMLTSSGAYAETLLPSGVRAFVRVGPVPDAFLDREGPPESIFATEPGSTTVIGIVQSQDVTLRDFGYSAEAIQQMFEQIAGSISQ